MRFITAIGRNRIERQKFCINTWSGFASEIVACNTIDDIEYLQPHFPNVQFVACPQHLTGTIPYHRPDRVSIYALAQLGPGLLINSDIKIDGISQQDFRETWTPESRVFKIGVRYDFDGPKTPKTLNPYGIDAFLLTEEIIDKIPNLGFVIGTSIWDYWLLWHIVAKYSYFVRTIFGHLLHLRHTSSWDSKDTDIGETIMRYHYGIDRSTLSSLIQVLTNRQPKAHKKTITRSYKK